MCLTFVDFQPFVAYKSVSYKKKRVTNNDKKMNEPILTRRLITLVFLIKVQSMYTLFFYKQHFYKQQKAENRQKLSKHQAISSGSSYGLEFKQQ